MNFSRKTPTYMQRQDGAAMMIMLVIMIVGVITFLVGALSNSSLKSARDQQASDVLVQARDALVGRAVSDASHPGSLPCPDNSAPGSPLWGTAAAFVGNICPSYIGRLPWKTLGIPELHDGNGEDLWYALSPTLRDHPTAQPINSDSPGWLSLTGTITLNNVAAIIFAPGAAICGQSRTASAAANQYLEALSTVSPTGPTAAIVRSASNDCSNFPYNDNLLAITTDQIFQPVEKRITREVKACLDEYAAAPVLTNGNLPGFKYPWASTVNPLSYSGSYGTLFGRVPYLLPNTSTSPAGAAATNVSAALSALQTALNNFVANGNSTNQTALISAGNYVMSLDSSIPAISGAIDTAGDWGQEFANGQHTQSGVQGQINTANAALAPYINVSPDPAMPIGWTPSCTTLFSSQYWPDWQELVFYQVSAACQPGSTSATCTMTANLSVSGSGNPNLGSGHYRATVVVAGKKIGTQIRPTYSSPPNDYLANIISEKNLPDPAFVPNAHNDTAPAPTFITYKTSDPYYQNVNDLVLCIDGKNYCK